jgi:hypothetical protein
VTAQKSPKWGVEIRSFLYTDDYGIDTYNWPHLFANGYAPLVDKNGLTFGGKAKGGSMPAFNNGGGIRVDVVRHLFPIAGGDYNRVDWSLGIGHRKYKTRESLGPYSGSFTDSAVVYQLNSLTQHFTQRYADIQTKAIYKVNGANGRCGVYLGFAMQMSLAFDGKIQEDFTSREVRWNTAGRDWSIIDKVDEHQNVPATKISYFSWGIPVGLFVKLSDHVLLLPEFSYWHNTNRKYYPDNFGTKKKSFSESGYLSIAIRYDW